jgi:hypothetical protein
MSNWPKGAPLSPLSKLLSSPRSTKSVSLAARRAADTSAPVGMLNRKAVRKPAVRLSLFSTMLTVPVVSSVAV